MSSSALRIATTSSSSSSSLLLPATIRSAVPRLSSANFIGARQQIHSPRFSSSHTFDPISASTSPKQRPSFIRVLLRTTRAVLLIGTGFFVTAALGIKMTQSSFSDAESVAAYTPKDAVEQQHDEYLRAHPTVAALRADPNFVESRPHLKIPPGFRNMNLTASTLMGPDRVPFPPVAWQDATGEKKEFVQISFVGDELCGHPGIVHGGYLATVMDEGLARCAFAALPAKMGMTANLNINYRAPCMSGQYIVLRGEVVKAEGRKVWVEGRIETLPEAGAAAKPVVLAEATGLFIQPKQLDSVSSFYSASS